MSYLMTQIFLYLICAFGLGLLLGWLIWGLGGPSQVQFDAQRRELDRLRSQR